MAFSVASWNVEFFGSKRRGESETDVAARIDRVFEFLRHEIDADVYAIYEVNGAQVFDTVTARFPAYSWQITEEAGTQEILVRHGIPAFITQRVEFTKGFSGPLRPGVLVTVSDGGAEFPMLFLHLKAADDPIDFGVRAYQHDKARSLRRTLDAVTAPQAPISSLGGLQLRGARADVLAAGHRLCRGDRPAPSHVRVRQRPHANRAQFTCGDVLERARRRFGPTRGSGPCGGCGPRQLWCPTPTERRSECAAGPNSQALRTRTNGFATIPITLACASRSPGHTDLRRYTDGQDELATSARVAW